MKSLAASLNINNKNLNFLLAKNVDESYQILRLEGKVNSNGDLITSLMSMEELTYLKSLIEKYNYVSEQDKYPIILFLNKEIYKKNQNNK
jgi:hypothetical protein